MPPKRHLYLETFGCQMNVLDSELVLNQLSALGYQQTESRDDADVILYNTCSVREHAEQKVWSRLGELCDAKQTRPGLVIGVIGCMAERQGKSIFTRFPYLDILCGPGELDKLPSLLQNAILAHSIENRPAKARDHQVALMGSTVRRSATLQATEDNLEALDLSRSFSPADGTTPAYVRITRGCNKFCSYCVVPYTRGPEIHRPPQNIVDEVKQLADAGHLEVTLLGQTVNHYQFKHPDGHITTFADLLYQVHEGVSHLPRLRFVTSFPRDFTLQALQAMRDCPRICHYLHIPAQSGSDRMLRMMNRGYSAGEYRDLIDRARELMPDISLASDFIVGFPTETDDEFRQTVELLEYCRFKNSFIFKYSPRPGTLALKYADDISEEVKRQRNNELLAVQGRTCARNNVTMIGQTVEILVEGARSLITPMATSAGKVDLSSLQKPTPAELPSMRQIIGRTRGDQMVAVNTNAQRHGKLIKVRITDARQLTLLGVEV